MPSPGWRTPDGLLDDTFAERPRLHAGEFQFDRSGFAGWVFRQEAQPDRASSASDELGSHASDMYLSPTEPERGPLLGPPQQLEDTRVNFRPVVAPYLPGNLQ
jgi:hypothetical protein